MSLLELFCHVDDFWQASVKDWEEEQLKAAKMSATSRSLVWERKHNDFDLLSQIEHTRHRSYANFMVNLVCGLIAYSL
jgi:hypothetical protein